MKKIIRRISEFGVSESDDIYDRRSIILTNYISLIFFSIGVLVLLVRFYYFFALNPYANFGLFFINLFILLPVIFNYCKFTTISRILIAYIPVLIIWTFFLSILKLYPKLETSVIDGLRFYLIAMSVIPYLILNRKNLLPFILGILPTLISILFMEQIIAFLFEEKYTAMAVGPDYILQNFRSIIAYIFIGSCSFMLHSIIVRTDTINASLIEKLDLQNKQLVEQQKLLNDSNTELEKIVAESTLKVKSQNEGILNFAHAIAHHVRGPIARLLGLTSLIKLEPPESKDFYIDKIADESKALDKILKDLSKDINEMHT